MYPNWYIDDFPVDIDPEYFKEDEEKDAEEGIIRESERWDDVPF